MKTKENRKRKRPYERDAAHEEGGGVGGVGGGEDHRKGRESEGRQGRRGRGGGERPPCCRHEIQTRRNERKAQPSKNEMMIGPPYPSRSERPRKAFLEGIFAGEGGGGIGSESPHQSNAIKSRGRGVAESQEARPGIRRAKPHHCNKGASAQLVQGEGAMCTGRAGKQTSISAYATRVRGCKHLGSFVQ